MYDFIFALGLAFLHAARETLTLFLFAILFAYFVAPLVSRLEKPLRGRLQAIGAVYLILIALLVGLGFLAGPKIAGEGTALATTLPSLLDKAGSGELSLRWARGMDGVKPGKPRSRTSLSRIKMTFSALGGLSDRS